MEESSHPPLAQLLTWPIPNRPPGPQSAINSDAGHYWLMLQGNIGNTLGYTLCCGRLHPFLVVGWLCSFLQLHTSWIPSQQSTTTQLMVLPLYGGFLFPVFLCLSDSWPTRVYFCNQYPRVLGFYPFLAVNILFILDPLKPITYFEQDMNFQFCYEGYFIVALCSK